MARRDSRPATKGALFAAFLCLLLVSLFVGGHASGQTKELPKPAPPGKSAQDPLRLPISIRGIVVDQNGKPVTSAQIVEIGHAWRHERLSARSDAAGNFTLVSRIPSFERHFVAHDEAGRRLGSGSCVFAKSAEPLRIVVRKPQEIVVHVTDGQGRPVADAKVAVTGLRMPVAVQMTVTDARGTATLRVPRDLAVQCVFVLKEGVGFDYSMLEQPRRLKTSQEQPAPDVPRSVNLVLDGAQRVRLHVVDESHAPLAGVLVRAVGIQRPGKWVPFEVGVTEIDELEATTDAAGIAEIRTIPLKREPGINFVCGTPGYSFRGPPLPDRSAAVCDVQVVAHPAAVVRVLVTLADGRPVPGAQLSGSYRSAPARGFGYWTAFCDEEGLSQLPGFREDTVGIVSAAIGNFASPVARFVEHKGQPIPPIHLVVRPATRVHGTATYGKGRQPLAAETVTLHQRDEGVAESASARQPSESAGMEISRFDTTDRQGRFEFFAAPGRYSIAIGPPVYVQVIAADMTGKSVSLEGGAKEFEIKDRAEIELNFASARPPVVDFDGRVVLESDRTHGVVDATVEVAPVDPQNVAGFRPVRTDADGAFHSLRRPCEMLVEAQSPDGSSCGLVRVFAGEKNVTIPIAAGTAARGVLVNATTGQPVRNQRIMCGIRLDFPRGGFRLAAPGGAVTNRQGEFELSGLPRGWKFECYAQLGPRRQANHAVCAPGRIHNR